MRISTATTGPTIRSAIRDKPFSQKNYGAAAGGPISIPHLYNGTDHTFFYFGLGRTEILPGAEGYHQRAHPAEPPGRLFANCDQLQQRRFRLRPTSTTPSTGPTIPMQPIAPDPLAGAKPCWVRPQFPATRFPPPMASSAPCGTGLTCPLSGQSKLFMNYMGFGRAQPHPCRQERPRNNRYDTINMTLPTDKFFFRIDEALRANQHLQGSLSRSMLTDDIPAPWLHAADSVTTDDDWSGSFLYTWTADPEDRSQCPPGIRHHQADQQRRLRPRAPPPIPMSTRPIGVSIALDQKQSGKIARPRFLRP